MKLKCLINRFHFCSSDQQTVCKYLSNFLLRVQTAHRFHYLEDRTSCDGKEEEEEEKRKIICSLQFQINIPMKREQREKNCCGKRWCDNRYQ